MPAQRNDPCPCGSGRKYKNCCYRKDRSAPDSESFLWRRLNAADEKLARDLLRFGARTLGEEGIDDAREDFLDGSDPEDEVTRDDMQTFVPWMLFAWRPFDVEETLGAPTIAAGYLARNGAGMDPFEREYLEACVAEPFSFYEVKETVPGEAVVVEDLLRGGSVRVNERSASGMMEPRDLMWAHVVTVRGFSTFSGVGSVPLLPIHKLEVIDAAEAIRGGRKGVSTADLHEKGDILRELYVALRFERLHPKMPELCNTDGEALALQKLAFRVEDPEAAFAKLADLEVMRPPEERERDVERDATGRFVRATIDWQKRGNKKMKGWDNTILGHLTIEGAALTVEVNSNERAKRIRKEIEKRLGAGVTFVRSVITSVEKALEEARAKGPRPPSRENEELRNNPEVKAQLREMVRRQYQAWPDQKIPALDGRTPRQALKSAVGRKKVEVLLADAEAHGTMGDPDAPLDLDFLRRELGLAPVREERTAQEPSDREPFDAVAVFRAARQDAAECERGPETSAVVAALMTVDAWCVDEAGRDPVDPKLRPLFVASRAAEDAFGEEGESEFHRQLAPRLPFDVLLGGDEKRATAADLFLLRHAPNLPKEAVDAVKALVAAEDTVARVLHKGDERVVEDLVAKKEFPIDPAMPLPKAPFHCRFVVFRGVAIPLAIASPGEETSAETLVEDLKWVIATASRPMHAAGIRLKSDAKAYGLGYVIMKKAVDSLGERTRAPRGGKKRR